MSALWHSSTTVWSSFVISVPERSLTVLWSGAVPVAVAWLVTLPASMSSCVMAYEVAV